MSRTTFSGTTVKCDYVWCPSGKTCDKTLTLAGEDAPENHGWGKVATLRGNCIWEPHDLCPDHYSNILRQLGIGKGTKDESDDYINPATGVPYGEA